MLENISDISERSLLRAARLTASRYTARTGCSCRARLARYLFPWSFGHATSNIPIETSTAHSGLGPSLRLSLARSAAAASKPAIAFLANALRWACAADDMPPP